MMRRPKLVVTIAFEPGRLGVRGLIDAYAQLVPVYKRRAKGNALVNNMQQHAVNWSYRRLSR